MTDSPIFSSDIICDIIPPFYLVLHISSIEVIINSHWGIARNICGPQTLLTKQVISRCTYKLFGHLKKKLELHLNSGKSFSLLFLDSKSVE